MGYHAVDEHEDDVAPVDFWVGSCSTIGRAVRSDRMFGRSAVRMGSRFDGWREGMKMAE